MGWKDGKINASSLGDHITPSNFEPRLGDVSLLYSKHVFQPYN